MKVVVDGVERYVAQGSKIYDVVDPATYELGTQVAVVRSTERLQDETSEFELVTEKGSMVLHVEPGPQGNLFKRIRNDLVGKSIRWGTSKVFAIGSFPTDLDVDRGTYHYGRWDCFFALGGFDRSTTYVMISQKDHDGSYGVDGGRLGRITRGRHVLERLEEGDAIRDIKPVVLEYSEKDAFIVDDLNLVLEDGMHLETYVGVSLNEMSPLACEHFLVSTVKGAIRIDEKTPTYAASTSRMEENMVAEDMDVRQAFDVTVRHQKQLTGKIYFYLARRQISKDHTLVGKVTNGHELIRLSRGGGRLSISTDPPRALSIGMSQSDGQVFLDGFGIVQERGGDTSDDAIIVEQVPDLTIEAIKGGTVRTHGVPWDLIRDVQLHDDLSPKSAEFFRKVTSLDHQPIGTMKVHFAYPGFSMVTFEGSRDLGKRLDPETYYGDTCSRLDIGVTNQARPNAGIIGIRVTDSNEFGPTGEERYGTNIVGTFKGDLDAMLEGLKEGDIVYIREVEGEEP